MFYWLISIAVALVGALAVPVCRLLGVWLETRADVEKEKLRTLVALQSLAPRRRERSVRKASAKPVIEGPKLLTKRG